MWNQLFLTSKGKWGLFEIKLSETLAKSRAGSTAQIGRETKVWDLDTIFMWNQLVLTSKENAKMHLIWQKMAAMWVTFQKPQEVSDCEMLAALTVTLHKAQEISDCDMLAAVSVTFLRLQESLDCMVFAVLSAIFHRIQEISDGLNVRCDSGYHNKFS